MNNQELDYKISKKIMGWSENIIEKSEIFPRFFVDSDKCIWVEYSACEDIASFSPSSNMYDAWKVAMAMVNDGFCPALLFDDNGHWAFVTDGAQSLSLGKDADDVSTSFLVEKKHWHDTAELAICHTALEVF